MIPKEMTEFDIFLSKIYEEEKEEPKTSNQHLSKQQLTQKQLNRFTECKRIILFYNIDILTVHSIIQLNTIVSINYLYVVKSYEPEIHHQYSPMRTELSNAEINRKSIFPILEESYP